MRRNLIYHIAPLSGARVSWRWNVDQLRRRLHHFDGRKFVAVALGPGCDGTQAVRDELGEDGEGVELLPVTNCPHLREVVSFELLLSKVLPEEGVTFFAHSKGVTHDGGKAEAPTHTWAQVLYESLLDYPAVVEGRLAGHATCGAYKRRGHFYNLGSFEECPWHYTGTFFWFKNEVIRQRDYLAYPRHRYGAESWAARVVRDHEAAGLLPDTDHRCSFYSLRHWERIQLPIWRIWQAQHAAFHAPPAARRAA